MPWEGDLHAESNSTRMCSHDAWMNINSSCLGAPTTQDGCQSQNTGIIHASDVDCGVKTRSLRMEYFLSARAASWPKSRKSESIRCSSLWAIPLEHVGVHSDCQRRLLSTHPTLPYPTLSVQYSAERTEQRVTPEQNSTRKC